MGNSPGIEMAIIEQSQRQLSLISGSNLFIHSKEFFKYNVKHNHYTSWPILLSFSALFWFNSSVVRKGTVQPRCWHQQLFSMKGFR